MDFAKCTDFKKIQKKIRNAPCYKLFERILGDKIVVWHEICCMYVYLNI